MLISHPKNNMITVKSFTLGPFQENTYVLSDETNECIIIDPGCYDESDRAELSNYLDANDKKPVRLINTHCHLDHMFGNGFVSRKYNLLPEFNKEDRVVFDSYLTVSAMYQLNVEASPEPLHYLSEGDKITFGKSSLEILFTPGHSPGSLTFYSSEQKFMIAGDVLFYGSIGRTDLPGGHHQTLIDSIKEKLFPLGDDFKVYSGHGPSTSIGFERMNNPFLV